MATFKKAFGCQSHMVRINLIDPLYLADQHLVAEYNEILMLLGYVKRYPDVTKIPTAYLLGPGHIRFFKDKLLYLQKRHELIKKEMKWRGFVPTKKIQLTKFNKELLNDWKPRKQDFSIIKKRISEKIRAKPGFYRYYREQKSARFLLDLLKRA